MKTKTILFLIIGHLAGGMVACSRSHSLGNKIAVMANAEQITKTNTASNVLGFGQHSNSGNAASMTAPLPHSMAPERLQSEIVQELPTLASTNLLDHNRFLESSQDMQSTTNIARFLRYTSTEIEEARAAFARERPKIVTISLRRMAGAPTRDGKGSYTYDFGFGNSNSLNEIYKWNGTGNNRTLAWVFRFFPNGMLKMSRLGSSSEGAEFFETGAIKNYFRTTSSGSYEVVFDSNGKIIRQSR